MASGGGHKPKMSASEPRPRGGWQRTTSMSDKEDNISLSSMPNELRPNNWDFSDWRPSSNTDQTKRRKKGNPEWEREQSLSQDSPPPSEHRHGTPRTFPRTKITPSTPTATRQALENLRQQLTFSDQEEGVSNDGERNNERNLLKRRENMPRYPRYDGETHLRPVANQRDDRNNRNNNKQNQNEMKQEETPGSSLMVSRLMQIRGYIKQASSMMDSLRKSGDPVDRKRYTDLFEIETYWKSQEIKCLKKLQNIWPGYRDELDRLQKMMDHLREQERYYTSLLQNCLSVREENGMNDMTRELSPNPDLLEETTSIDLDVQSEVSDREERSVSATSASLRPRIEDRLGLTPDIDVNDEEEEEEVEEELAQSESSDNSGTMDDTVIASRKNRDQEIGFMEDELAAGGFQNPKEAAETLIALRQQQELLTKLVEQQEQMRALRDRQSALLALQQDAESKLATARQKSNDARSQSKSLEEVASNLSNRADALVSVETNTGRQADPTLHDIRQQLQYLRNELKSQVGENELNMQSPEASGVNISGNQTDRKTDKPVARAPPHRPPSPRVAERLAAAMNFPPPPGSSVPPTEMSRDQLQARLADLLTKRDKLDELISDEFSAPLMTQPAEDMNQDQLQNKLRDLQRKKSRMDDMLQEIQSLRSNPVLLLNNGAAPTSQPSGSTAQSAMDHDDPVHVSTQGTEAMADGVVDMLEARQKLQKLNEVKDRLNSLKSLVHYYRSVEDNQGRSGEAEDQSSIPAYSDYDGEQEQPTRDRGMQNIPVQETRQGRDGMGKTTQNIPVRVQQNLDESDENNSSSNSDSESQMSSLGPWGDDPEIQEKLKKLKSAKDKLKRLQNLVNMVQHAPEAANQLPGGLAGIAANIEDVESQLAGGEHDRNNASASEGEVPEQAERDLYYHSKMEEQMTELEQLKDEKERLLAIQNQLQTLHDRFQQGEQGAVDMEDEDEVDARVPQQASRSKSQNKTQQNNQQQQQQQQQQSTGPSVTFSSNEEVYDKMRKQRMLREELRDKKKQLESIMKKDRNRKQYYKNQDNQSDTVSYSTEAFGATASVDATMATWGGSTVDNLESITEDGAADPQDNEEDEEDDAYPIDGILQVEEEEEENQSDNETYTIEEDVRQRRKARAMQNANTAEMNVRKTKRTFPRARSAGARPKEAWTRQGDQDFNKWSRSNRKSRQENFRSAEDILQEDESEGPQNRSIEELQKQLEQTSLLCQSLLDHQSGPQLSRQPAAGFGSHSQLMPDIQQQLQQQQLMMSLNQCYQQISMQQMEMQNMQRQMQTMYYQMADNSELNDSSMMSDVRNRSLQPSLFSPMLARQSPNILLPGDPFQFNPIYQHMSPNTRLLRRAESDNTFNRADQGEAPERQRNVSARGARSSRTDSYVQKKKSLSPQMNNASGKYKSAVNKSYTEEDMEDKEAENAGYDSDHPMTAAEFEQYLARKRREFFERNKLPDYSKQQTSADASGVRRSSKSKTTEENQQYRPGLSAGISGAGYQEDGRSVTSSVLSSVAAMAQALSGQPENREARESDDPNEMSLFETLRETIYSEVATLISQNENRPHYLIELFRELQLLTTDYLRQRVLYDIKDVVSKFLVEENSVSAPPPPWMNASAGNYTQSELTPSESIVTSDEEDVKYLMQTKLKQKVAANLVAREQKRREGKSGGLVRSGSLKNDQYDYQESAEQDSSVSTPSNSYWDSPFNQDPLGETVIHFDKEKMREYEKRLAMKDVKVKTAVERLRRVDSADVCSSSAMDQGSESSVTSDSVPYPRIDTQQLDQQIKSIMTEVIPVIKEHMDNMCSPQLLAYIKRLVLSLTRQYGGGQEFARFFHRQLGSILQDTLAKYEGRKMRECGEDLLVDMSEVLFNELAFFRLMQDLDDPLIAEKLQKAQVGEEAEKDEEKEKEPYEESDTTESTANASDNPDQDDQDDETKATQTEEEDLGKARDDALASEMEIQDADDKDDDPESPFKGVQIELAPSETKPYTRIGSDEDDESATDESQSNEDPSETAVSINARRKNNNEDVEEDGTSDVVTAGMDAMGESSYQLVSEDQTQDADQGAGSVVQPTTEHMNGDILNGDIEVITMDDLPSSLTVMSSEDLQQKLSQEEQLNNGAAVILDATEGQQELAGDPHHIKEPGETSC